jgi:hypothetical protein
MKANIRNFVKAQENIQLINPQGFTVGNIMQMVVRCLYTFQKHNYVINRENLTNYVSFIHYTKPSETSRCNNDGYYTSSR